MRSASGHDQRVLDDLFPATSPRPGAQHFAALCRGVIVLVGLTLPVGLTLAFASPPKGGDDGRASSKAVGFATPDQPASRVSRPPRADGAAGA